MLRKKCSFFEISRFCVDQFFIPNYYIFKLILFGKNCIFSATTSFLFISHSNLFIIPERFLIFCFSELSNEVDISLATFGLEIDNDDLLEEVEPKKNTEKSSSSEVTKKLESASSSKSVGATDKKEILKLLAINANAFNSFMKGQQQLVMKLDD